jgi:hypothetical protein
MRNQRSQSNQTTANLTKFYKSAPRDTQEKGAPDQISELSESEVDWISRIYGNITETEESSYYRHWTNYYLLPRSISLANSRRCPGPWRYGYDQIPMIDPTTAVIARPMPIIANVVTISWRVLIAFRVFCNIVSHQTVCTLLAPSSSNLISRCNLSICLTHSFHSSPLMNFFLPQ